MEGYKFKEQRESIQTIFGKVEQFLDKKDSEKAEKALKKSQVLLTRLSNDIEENEIQERSILNMNIQLEHLSKKVSELSGH